MNGIPLTRKVTEFLNAKGIHYQAFDKWTLHSVSIGHHTINISQHPNCCSEVDVSSYGARITDDEADVLFQLLKLYPEHSKYVRVTTRIASTKKRVKAPKGFKKLATTVSGHGPSHGYVHFYHAIIGEKV